MISPTLIGITKVVEFSFIAFQRTMRGNEDGLPLSIERLGSPVHSRGYAATILSMAKRAMIPLFLPTFRLCLRT